MQRRGETRTVMDQPPDATENAGSEARDKTPVSYTHLDVYKRQLIDRIVTVSLSSAVTFIARP